MSVLCLVFTPHYYIYKAFSFLCMEKFKPSSVWWRRPVCVYVRTRVCSHQAAAPYLLLSDCLRLDQALAALRSWLHCSRYKTQMHHATTSSWFHIQASFPPAQGRPQTPSCIFHLRQVWDSGCVQQQYTSLHKNVVNLCKSTFWRAQIGRKCCNLCTLIDAQCLIPIHLPWRCAFSHLCSFNKSPISVTEGWQLPSQVLSHCHPQASISLWTATTSTSALNINSGYLTLLISLNTFL